VRSDFWNLRLASTKLRPPAGFLVSSGDLVPPWMRKSARISLNLCFDTVPSCTYEMFYYKMQYAIIPVINIIISIVVNIFCMMNKLIINNNIYSIKIVFFIVPVAK